MIRFESIKSSVNYAMANKEFTSKSTENDNQIDKLIACSLLAVFLYSLGQQNDSNLGNMRTLATNYAASFKNIAESLKGTYTAYKDIKLTIDKYKVYNFMTMTQREMNEIYEIYCNKKYIEPFNINYFTVSMYGLGSTTAIGEKRLRDCHNNVIIPIVKYYTGLLNTSLTISVENYYDSNPGRAVKLKIDEIPSSRIVSDIDKKKIRVYNYLYKYNLLDDGSVVLELK